MYSFMEVKISMWCRTAQYSRFLSVHTYIHRSSPKMGDLRGTHDNFCKIRPKKVFQVSVEWY